MMIQIPPRDSYDVETGRYRATCIDAKEIQKQTRKGSEKFLRLTWELPNSQRRECALPGRQELRTDPHQEQRAAKRLAQLVGTRL
jgi:hypothetical protein